MRLPCKIRIRTKSPYPSRISLRKQMCGAIEPEPPVRGLLIGECSGNLTSGYNIASWGFHSAARGSEKTHSNAPDRDRTCDLRFRKPPLYPTELRAHSTLPCVASKCDGVYRPQGNRATHATPYGEPNGSAKIRSGIGVILGLLIGPCTCSCSN